MVSEKDRGSQILGSPDDLIVVALDEHVAGGYTWDIEGVSRAGMTLEKDGRITATQHLIGGPVRRRLVVHGEGSGWI